MGRTLLAGLLALALGACQDPIVIIGDLPGFMRVVAGVPDSSGIRNDSSALQTKVVRPAGLAVSKAGVLYFADQSSRIFSVTSAGKLDVIAQSLNCFEKSCLGRPQGMALSIDENSLYIADDMSDKIWRVTIANGDMAVVAGTGVNGVAPDGTVATQAPLSSPNGIVVLPDGRVAFAERNAFKVRVIASDGTLRTLAGTGVQGSAADGVAATAAPLDLPTGLALGNNVLYVSEQGNNSVRAVDLASGTIKRIAGNGTAGFSGDGGLATDASLNSPGALAVLDNSLYIADQLNDRVRVVNLQSDIISTFAGTGTRIFSGNGASAAQTSIYNPFGLATSTYGFLYISDYGHSVVWRTPVRANIQ